MVGYVLGADDMAEKTLPLFPSSDIRESAIKVFARCFGRWVIFHTRECSTNATNISSRWQVNYLSATQVCPLDLQG